MSGRIHVGMGGWTFDPWCETFYPKDLPLAQQLSYASRQVTAIEINGTYYRTQAPATFAKWYAQTPDAFIFSVKASRYATNRKQLGAAGEAISRFVNSGLSELGEKLGPIIWQLAPTKHFEPEDIEAFLGLLPPQVAGRRLRHVIDARHASFMCSQFLALARHYEVATVVNDSDDYPSFADLTSDIVYVRLMRSDASIATGYAEGALAQWAERARTWADGGEPTDLPRVETSTSKSIPRDVFMFFISGAKECAPSAAQALISRLRGISESTSSNQ